MAFDWTPIGPRPTTGGQVEGIADEEVVGAINAVAAHPTNPDIVYVGAVNGGVWRTRNARNARPTWEQLTDAQRSQSIGALEFDPTDSTCKTLVAGTGRFSSLRRMGAALIGLFRTTDGAPPGPRSITAASSAPFTSVTSPRAAGPSPLRPLPPDYRQQEGVFRTTDAG